MLKHRALVLSHGHPDFSLGGGEIAAFNLFEALKHTLTQKQHGSSAVLIVEMALQARLAYMEATSFYGSKVWATRSC